MNNERVTQDQDRNQIREITQRTTEVLSALASEYVSIYNINLETGESFAYQTGPGTEDYIDELVTRLGFWTVFPKYVNSDVVPEDREKVLAAINPDALRNTMLQQNNLELNYAAMYKKVRHHIQIRCIRLGEDSINVMLGVRLRDEEVRRMDEKFRNNRLIESLASQYDSVYYYDVASDLLTPYTRSVTRKEPYTPTENTGFTYASIFPLYVEKYVHPMDRERMTAFGEKSHILQELAHQKTTSILFRSNTGDTRFSQLKYVKVDDIDDKPTGITMALSESDQQLVYNFVHERMLREYDAINLVDLDAGTVRPSLPSRLFTDERMRTGIHRDACMRYAELVAPEFRDEWIRLGDTEYLKQYLMDVEHREFIYRLPMARNQEWRRCITQVVERRDGVPSLVIMSYMGVDAFHAKTLDQERRIEQQNHELEERRQQLELALRQANAASQAKSAFLSNMSHDIRTPMNAIMGFTQLAISEAAGNEALQDYLNKILISGGHLLDLINDVLDMSRIEAGKLLLKKDLIDLEDVMQNLATVLYGRINEKRLTLNVSTDGIHHRFVTADRLRLGQILLNLAGNSIKFTPEGGRIDILMNEKPSDKPQTALYELTVRDTGIGMSPDFVDHIFEFFSRERTSTVSKTEGTGLGMAITKNIVETMGGWINVHSQEGVGTEIIVHLPLPLGSQDDQPVEIT